MGSGVPPFLVQTSPRPTTLMHRAKHYTCNYAEKRLDGLLGQAVAEHGPCVSHAMWSGGDTGLGRLRDRHARETLREIHPLRGGARSDVFPVITTAVSNSTIELSHT